MTLFPLEGLVTEFHRNDIAFAVTLGHQELFDADICKFWMSLIVNKIIIALYFDHQTYML